jgi:hypothetical protein
LQEGTTLLSSRTVKPLLTMLSIEVLQLLLTGVLSAFVEVKKRYCDFATVTASSGCGSDYWLVVFVRIAHCSWRTWRSGSNSPS